jgi:hypothetical protein
MLDQKQSLFEIDMAAFLEVISTAIVEWIQEWDAKGKVIPPAKPRGEPQTLGDLLDQLEREGGDRS